MSSTIHQLTHISQSSNLLDSSRPNTANRSQHHLQVSHPPCFCLSICQHRVTWHRNTPKMAGGPSRVGRVRGSIGHLFAEALCEVHDPFLETSDIVGWETPSTVTHYTVARNGIMVWNCSWYGPYYKQIMFDN